MLPTAANEADVNTLARVIDDLRLVRHGLEAGSEGGQRCAERTHELLSGIMKSACGSPISGLARITLKDVEPGVAIDVLKYLRRSSGRAG